MILTGCGHAGIVNIVRYAHRLTGVDTVAAIVGGFHLSGPAFEPAIQPTIDALAEIGAQTIIPAHCTGWRAAQALAARMPDAYIDGGVPGYAIPPSAQVARFPNSGIRHTRGMTNLLKARHGETVPLALHASRPQQLPTNASPHDPRRTYGGDH